MPLSYLAVSFETVSTDHHQPSSSKVEQFLHTPALETEKATSHDVMLYADIDGSWTAGEPQAIEWDLLVDGHLLGDLLNSSSGVLDNYVDAVITFNMSLANQVVFGEAHERATWGSTFWSTSRGSSSSSLSYAVGRGLDTQSRYIESLDLASTLSTSYRNSDELSFAFVHSFSNVSEGDVLYTVGNVQQPAVQYLSKRGLDHLDPYWKTCNDPPDDDKVVHLIRHHHDQFWEYADKAAYHNTKLRSGKSHSLDPSDQAAEICHRCARLLSRQRSDTTCHSQQLRTSLELF